MNIINQAFILLFILEYIGILHPYIINIIINQAFILLFILEYIKYILRS